VSYRAECSRSNESKISHHENTHDALLARTRDVTAHCEMLLLFGFADWRRLVSLCLYARGLPVFQKETVVHIVAVNQLSRD